MAWNIGANDVANSMATAVGARAITHRQAVLIAGVLTFLGAVLVGSNVTETIKGNIVDPCQIADAHILMLGFVASLLAASVFVTLATWREMPISTTHSIIGALVGFGIVAGGTTCINWGKLAEVAASWVLSPLVGCVLAFFVFKIIVKLIFSKQDPVEAAKIVGPGIIGVTVCIIVISLLTKTNLGMMIGVTNLFLVFGIAIGFGVCFTVLSAVPFRRIQSRHPDDYETVELLFRKLQIGTSCFVAFSHGANDVANAIGPVAGILSLTSTGSLNPLESTPTVLLALGGIGIALGAMTWGHKVMKTVGGRITSLTNTRGFSVDFGAATTVLLASILGLPISTSHTVVGAVIGVGLAKGLAAIDLSVIKKIIYSWLLTVPLAAGLSAIFFILLRMI
ncbi:MAG: inorganic phosphate transporter [Candidatus Thermoplasmatota archaeon]|nr:inorganic phosphate transporter [Candidatus Thermoplasmatota archaeon]